MSYIFTIFTETHKIPLTEIVCLRIVYATGLQTNHHKSRKTIVESI